MTDSETRTLLAEARHEESIQDKLGDGFSEGSEERAFYYEHRDRYKRLADALEARQVDEAAEAKIENALAWLRSEPPIRPDDPLTLLAEVYTALTDGDAELVEFLGERHEPEPVEMFPGTYAALDALTIRKGVNDG